VNVVTSSRSGQVARITISRPERRNALHHGALEELHDAVRSARLDEVRVVVLTGDADHFCSGADLTELEDLEFTIALRAMLDDLAALPVPTIAAISGACMGLGMQLALACDLRIATDDARFAVPVAKLGLMVDHWTVQRLAMCAGISTARWMTLTARPITAERAHQVGLVQELVATGDGGPGASVLAAAEELAQELAALAPLTLAGTKAGLDLLERGADQIDPDGAYRAAFHTAWASEDLVEGRQAFTDRRPAKFEGR
jgi:enoyl-CoA hydratase